MIKEASPPLLNQCGLWQCLLMYSGAMEWRHVHWFMVQQALAYDCKDVFSFPSSSSVLSFFIKLHKTKNSSLAGTSLAIKWLSCVGIYLHGTLAPRCDCFLAPTSWYKATSSALFAEIKSFVWHTFT